MVRCGATVPETWRDLIVDHRRTGARERADARGARHPPRRRDAPNLTRIVVEGADRTRPLAAVVARFSTLAGVAIALLLASGIVQGLVEVRTLDNLFDTAFGRAVLIKIVLFAAIVALAAGYAPSIAESSGPFSGSADLGPARLELTVDPARVGPNEIHVYLFDRSDGKQYDETKELTVMAELPEQRIAPIHFDAIKAGPGHYVVSGAALGVSGDWTVEIVARVSDFDEHRATVEVPIE